MVNLSEKLEYWLQQDGLIGTDKNLFCEKINHYQSQFNSCSEILIVEENPEEFLAALIAALRGQKSIFFGNPHWKTQEWQQVFERVQPDLILGKIPENVSDLSKNELTQQRRKHAESYFYIPTGGSSGQIKFVTHSWQTLRASVEGMQRYFEVEQIHSFCILPLYHVSGLMQFIRAFLTTGKLQIYDYSQLKNNPPNQNYRDYFISLVPTQLQFLLNHCPQWLTQFKTVLLGGAPAWPGLLEQAKLYKIKLAPTYGMSETASQIVTLKPADFARNYTGVGLVLPQTKITIVNEKGDVLENNQIGLINIQSESLFWGYYPELGKIQHFCPGDLGYFDQQGYLYIVGRLNQQINTGGEKVFPGEIEAVILASHLVEDVLIFGLEHSQWGEVVVAVYVPKSPTFEIKILQNYLKQNLAAYKIPKYWQARQQIERSPSGKVNYAELKAQFKTEFEPN